jgi:hypothetical protein
MSFNSSGRHHETTLVEKVCTISAVLKGYLLKKIAATHGLAKSTGSRIGKAWCITNVSFGY